MIKFLLLFFLFTLVSCSSNKNVFWCGDHECVNKAEKEAYFKKNMVVEVRKKNESSNEEISKVNEIIQQATLKKHSVHHTKKHMSSMKKAMKKGKSFKQAHNKAMRKVGR